MEHLHGLLAGGPSYLQQEGRLVHLPAVCWPLATFFPVGTLLHPPSRAQRELPVCHATLASFMCAPQRVRGGLPEGLAWRPHTRGSPQGRDLLSLQVHFTSHADASLKTQLESRQNCPVCFVKIYSSGKKRLASG